VLKTARANAITGCQGVNGGKRRTCSLTDYLLTDISGTTAVPLSCPLSAKHDESLLGRPASPLAGRIYILIAPVLSRVRALVAVLGLSLLTIAALAAPDRSCATPQVEAAVKAFQTLASDANRLKTFCELIEIEQENEEKAGPLLATKMDKMLDELGTDFKAAWKSVEDIDPASDDGKILYTALDRLLDKCSD
jgi:hypothetical protein